MIFSFLYKNATTRSFIESEELTEAYILDEKWIWNQKSIIYQGKHHTSRSKWLTIQQKVDEAKQDEEQLCIGQGQEQKTESQVQFFQEDENITHIKPKQEMPYQVNWGQLIDCHIDHSVQKIVAGIINYMSTSNDCVGYSGVLKRLVIKLHSKKNRMKWKTGLPSDASTWGPHLNELVVLSYQQQGRKTSTRMLKWPLDYSFKLIWKVNIYCL